MKPVFALLVENVTPETPRVKTLRLRPEGDTLPFTFFPGQHLGVRPCTDPVTRVDNNERWKHFSLSSSAENKKSIEITVLNQGKASDTLHQLSPGDRVEVTQPVGGFILEEPVGYGPVFFAAGIGAAPVRSMIRTCLDRGLGTAVTAFFLFSSPEEALYVEQFGDWSEEDQRFFFWVGYSQTQSEGTMQSGKDCLLNPGFLEEHTARLQQRTCYLCLPPGIREEVEAVLSATGVPPVQIRKEIW